MVLVIRHGVQGREAFGVFGAVIMVYNMIPASSAVLNASMVAGAIYLSNILVNKSLSKNLSIITVRKKLVYCNSFF